MSIARFGVDVGKSRENKTPITTTSIQLTSRSSLLNSFTTTPALTMQESFMDRLQNGEFEATCGVNEETLDYIFHRYCGSATPIKKR